MDNIIIEAPNDTTLTIKGGNLVSIKAKYEIRDENILVEMFNIIRICSKTIGNPLNLDHDKCTVQNFIPCYKNHSSIIKIKKKIKNLASFDFPEPTVEDISLIIKSLNPRKTIRPECIPQIIKFASNVFDSPFCDIVIKDLKRQVRPIFKKNAR